MTLESDKATMEVPASAGGVVKELRVKVGDKVSQGTVLATLEAAEAAGTDAADAACIPPKIAAGIVASDAGASEEVTPRRHAGTDRAPTPPLPPRRARHRADAASAERRRAAAAVHASPAIRRFARELGVDLSRVHGSGPNGRITRDDVQGFVKTAIASPSPAGGGGTPARRAASG